LPIAAPFRSAPVTIEPEWLDGNGHLNMAYYLVVSERGLDQAWSAMGIGWEYARETGLSTFAAEVHMRYLRELLGDTQAVVTFQVLEVDEKRLRGVSEIRDVRDGAVAATTEQVWLHVDLATRRVTPWPREVRQRLEAWRAAHASLPVPGWAGAGIAMRQR
jgi:acyl-CoA thioester hydrolase